MTDYLIQQYNAKMSAIQDREAKALTGALEIYVGATRAIVEAAALERVDVGVELAAAMNQRDHEYHHGRPAPLPPPEPIIPMIGPPKESAVEEPFEALGGEAA